MVTVFEALTRATDYLKPFSDEAEGEAKKILSFLLGIETSRLVLSDKKVDLKELEKILARRKKGEPLQYILGKWWFYEGEFLVGKGVLIPRQDTETLVEVALDELKEKKNASVADLCAGSGAIGISIAAKRPDITVLAVEKYKRAYEFLEKNILLNRVKNVKSVRADVLKKPFGCYDMIVSNPPYITTKEMASLQTEVKKEPKTALFGGEDGLDFYRTISAKWKSTLKENGILMFEIGATQASAVAEIMKKEGFTDITLKKDLCGVQRVIFGTVKDI